MCPPKGMVIREAPCCGFSCGLNVSSKVPVLTFDPPLWGWRINLTTVLRGKAVGQWLELVNQGAAVMIEFWWLYNNGHRDQKIKAHSLSFLPCDTLWHFKIRPARMSLTSVAPQPWTQAMSQNKPLFLIKYLVFYMNSKSGGGLAYISRAKALIWSLKGHLKTTSSPQPLCREYFALCFGYDRHFTVLCISYNFVVMSQTSF